MTFKPDNFTVWMEIPVSDLDKAIGFYNKVLKTELNLVTDMGPNPVAMFPTKKRNRHCRSPVSGQTCCQRDRANRPYRLPRHA